MQPAEFIEPLPEDDALPEENNSAEPEAIARALQAVIEQKDAEIAALKDQSLRALAEVENIRRRAERETADTAKYAVSKFAGDLVSVLENLMRATSSITDAQKETSPLFKNLAIGVEMTMQELLASFEKYGIRRIDPIGQKFDHQLHQAVTQIENSEAEAGTVVQVMQAGYIIHDRLLRPAMVGVATSNSSSNLVDTQA
jgi:molecular chaperone GrpE